jgi:putative hydrolase of the HAD superfamily
VLDIEDLTDAFCCSEESGALKPAAEPFLLLSRRLGIDPERILYVGNSCEKDIVGAHALGMKTALLKTGFPVSRAGCPLADITFRRFGDLPQLLTSYL